MLVFAKEREIRFSAMNTSVTALFPDAEEQGLSQLADIVKQRFELSEARFSRFRDESELCALNRHTGSLSIISDEMLEVLQLAQHYQALTAGWFDITILPALERAGYNQSFETLVMQPEAITSEDNDHPAMLRKEQSAIILDNRMRSVHIQKGSGIDLGGLVKSWTVRKLVNDLREVKNIKRGLINAGGDLMAWGGAGTEEPWQVGFEDPWNPGTDYSYILLSQGSMATSSTLGRRWNTSKGGQHHLIDPWTKKSSQSDVVQCTVLGPDPITCEVWAKTMCISGSEEGRRLFIKHAANYEALLFTESKQTIRVRGEET